VPFAEKKRFIQSEARRIRNHASKSRVKTLMKRVSSALEADDTAAADSHLRNAISAIQKAGRKRILHPNTAARRIAQLSKMVRR
jgi:small subunit ribosomal protein S20